MALRKFEVCKEDFIIRQDTENGPFRTIMMQTPAFFLPNNTDLTVNVALFANPNFKSVTICECLSLYIDRMNDIVYVRETRADI